MSKPTTFTVANNLPVEIWNQIIKETTSLPGKDEFSVDITTWYSCPYDSATTRSDIGEEELSSIIRVRYNIIRVCKSWYVTGRKELWSHLRLELSSTSGSHLTVHDSLRRAPELATFVKRLTIKGRGFPTSGWIARLGFITNLASQLPSLKIISCPLICGVDQYPLPTEITILENFSRILALSGVAKSPSLSSWSHTRALIVDFGRSGGFSKAQSEISLPQLLYLRVRALGPDTIQYITREWKLPNLSILVIRGIHIAIWDHFLRNNAGIAKLDIMFNTDVENWGTITFPRLTSLYVNAQNELTCNGIDAPMLERFGILNVRSQNSLYAVNWVKRAKKLVPTIGHVCLAICTSEAPQSRLSAVLLREEAFFRQQGVEFEVIKNGL